MANAQASKTMAGPGAPVLIEPARRVAAKSPSAARSALLRKKLETNPRWRED